MHVNALGCVIAGARCQVDSSLYVLYQTDMQIWSGRWRHSHKWFKGVSGSQPQSLCPSCSRLSVLKLLLGISVTVSSDLRLHLARFQSMRRRVTFNHRCLTFHLVSFLPQLPPCFPPPLMMWPRPVLKGHKFISIKLHSWHSCRAC